MRGLVVVGVLAVAAGHAHADKLAEAGKAFAAGQAADERGAYDDAIAFYQRAYDLKPHPNAVYNIAFDYERLGKFRVAVTWYEKYITETSEASEQEKTRTHIAELRDHEARLIVDSEPAGAVVSVDGAIVGKTHYESTLLPGKHMIFIGTQPREVDVLYGEPVELAVSLTPEEMGLPPIDPAVNPPSLVDPTKLAPAPGEPGGGIRVLGGPTGAYVFIDNQPVGVIGTWSGSIVVALGSHDVEIRASGMAPFKKNVYVHEHKEENVTVEGMQTTEEAAEETSVKVRRIFGAGVGFGYSKNKDDDSTELGELAFAEFGTRVKGADFIARLGESHGHLAVDVGVRYGIGKARVKPLIGIGYSYIGGVGYELIAGLRFDLKRYGQTRLSFVLESGIRVQYIAPEDDTPDDGFDPPKEAQALVPVIGFLEVIR